MSSAVQVAIVDYGMGNLKSVFNAVHAVGGEAFYVAEADELKGYSHIILPGVGAFSDAMAVIKQKRFDEALNEQVALGTSVLGLCLGMQVMCRSSDEGQGAEGLGWFDMDVRHFSDIEGLKVPHIGWNDLSVPQDRGVMRGIESGSDVYFVHSHRVCTGRSDEVLAWCDYGERFAAVIAKDNVQGIQFHPEKSQQTGLKMLKNFIEDCHA